MAPTKLTIKNTNLNQGQQHLLSIYSISVHSFTRGMVWKWNCETGDALSRVLLFWCCGASRSATGNVVDWHGRGGQNRRVNTRHLFSGSIVLHMKFISTSIGRIYYKNNHVGLSLPLPQTLYKRAHYAISDSIMLRQCKASQEIQQQHQQAKLIPEWEIQVHLELSHPPSAQREISLYT
jgi:hypothetical protein